jgi:hypothetical protein
LPQREAAQHRALQLLSKFVPSMQPTEWVDRVDGEGGFAVFESDDPVAMTRDFAIWSPIFHFELHPVLDILEATPAQQEAADFRESVS